MKFVCLIFFATLGIVHSNSYCSFQEYCSCDSEPEDSASEYCSMDEKFCTTRSKCKAKGDGKFCIDHAYEENNCVSSLGCTLPAATSRYSLITKGDAGIGAKLIKRNLFIGNVLKIHDYDNHNIQVNADRGPGKSYYVEGAPSEAYVQKRVEFKDGYETGQNLNIHPDDNFDFEQFEWLAQHAQESDINGYKVFVRNQTETGKEYSNSDFLGEQGQPDHAGKKTLVIFTSSERVVLKKAVHDRQFGPSIIAPFATVALQGEAGFVDGFIVAKRFYTTNTDGKSDEDQLELRGNFYEGTITCDNVEACPATTPCPTQAPSTKPSTEASTGNKGSPGTKGDPHFKTWKNEHFEYHGECDMVLVKDEDFAGGVGIHVHIRTQLVRYWSYIRSASIMIGDDILELEGSADSTKNVNEYWYNYEYHGEIEGLGGFPVIAKVQSEHKRSLTIDLDRKYPGQKIVISTYKEFVRVDFKNGTEASFGNSVGLLGDFKSGKTFARDGSTVIDDFYKLGPEWQVLPEEPMLFHEVRQPQFPARCREPTDPRGSRTRRLGQMLVSEEQAEKACAHLSDAADRKDCMYDILATQDLGMVGAY